jgi:molecular chaperone DnaK
MAKAVGIETSYLDRVRSLTGELQQLVQGLMARVAGPPPRAAGRRPSRPGGTPRTARTARTVQQSREEEIVDAEFTAS